MWWGYRVITIEILLAGVSLFLLIPVTAAGQGFKFRMGAGKVMFQRIPSTFLPMVELYYYPDKHWGVGADLGMWKQVAVQCKQVPKFLDGYREFCEEVNFMDVSMSLNIVAETRIFQTFGLFLGGGLGSHALRSRSESMSFGFQPGDLAGNSIRVGYEVFSGLDIRLNHRWGVFFIGRYEDVPGVRQWRFYGGVQTEFRGGGRRKGTLRPGQPEHEPIPSVEKD